MKEQQPLDGSSGPESVMNTVKTSSKEIAKKIWSPESKLRTRYLIDKALKAQQIKANSKENILNKSLDPNDSIDFKDAPKLRKTTAKLKLRSSSLDKEPTLCTKDSSTSSKVTQQNAETAAVQTSRNPAASADGKVLRYDVNGIAPSKEIGAVVPALGLPDTDNLNQNLPSSPKLETPRAPVAGESEPTACSISCVICGVFVTSAGYEEHRLACLRDRFTKDSGGNTSPEPVEKKRCDVCCKIISSLNSRAQTQHINNCLDKIEREKQQEEKHKQLLIQAKEALLGCPLCRKNFKSQRGRQGHLKRCAKDNGMTVERLKLLMKQQEEGYSAKLEAGILPEEFVAIKKKIAVAPKKKRTTHPKTSLDEDTQLALALSNSLVKDESRSSADFAQPSMKLKANAEEEKCQVPTVVQALFPAAGKAAAVKGKKGKQLEDTKLLLTLSKEQAAGRISSRVDSFIFSTVQNQALEKTPPFKTDSRLQASIRLPSSTISSSTEARDSPQTSLWNKASFEGPSKDGQVLPTTETRALAGEPELCPESRQEKTPEGSAMQFYVGQLMPPISVNNVQAGSKIKRVSAIAGRRKSGDRNRKFHTETSERNAPMSVSPDVSDTEVSHGLETSPHTNINATQVSFASEVPPSQTVEDLAQLALESDTATAVISSSLSVDKSGEDRLCDASMENIRERPSTSQGLGNLDICGHQPSFGSLVNNGLYSDVSILVAETDCSGCDGTSRSVKSKRIRAHKIILHVQCPQLLALCVSGPDGDEIDLSDFEEEPVLALLKFLYSGGGIHWLSEHGPQLAQLALRFSSHKLSQAFQHNVGGVSESGASMTTKESRSDGEGPCAQKVNRNTLNAVATETVCDTRETGLSRASCSVNVVGQSALDLESALLDEESVRDVAKSSTPKVPNFEEWSEELSFALKEDIREYAASMQRKESEMDKAASKDTFPDSDYTSMACEEKPGAFLDCNSQSMACEEKPGAFLDCNSQSMACEEKPGAFLDCNSQSVAWEENPVNFLDSDCPPVAYEERPDTFLDAECQSVVYEAKMSDIETAVANEQKPETETVRDCDEATTETPKKRKRQIVTAKQFKLAVKKLEEAKQGSKGSSEASVDDEILKKIVIKIDNTMESLHANDSVFYPSVLETEAADADELTIVSAYIKDPVYKKKQTTPRRTTQVGEKNVHVQSTEHHRCRARPTPPQSMTTQAGSIKGKICRDILLTNSKNEGQVQGKTSSVSPSAAGGVGAELCSGDKAINSASTPTRQGYWNSSENCPQSFEKLIGAEIPTAAPIGDGYVATSGEGYFSDEDLFTDEESPSSRAKKPTGDISNFGHLRTSTVVRESHVPPNLSPYETSSDKHHQKPSNPRSNPINIMSVGTKHSQPILGLLKNAEESDTNNSPSASPSLPSPGKAWTKTDQTGNLSRTPVKKSQHESGSKEGPSVPSTPTGIRKTLRGLAKKNSPIRLAVAQSNGRKLMFEASDKPEGTANATVLGNDSFDALEDSPRVPTNNMAMEPGCHSPQNETLSARDPVACRKSLDFSASSHSEILTSAHSNETLVTPKVSNCILNVPSRPTPLLRNPETVETKGVGDILKQSAVQQSPLPLRERLQMKIPFGSSACLDPSVQNSTDRPFQTKKSLDETRTQSTGGCPQAPEGCGDSSARKVVRFEMNIQAFEEDSSDDADLLYVGGAEAASEDDPLLRLSNPNCLTQDDDDDDDDFYLLEETERCEVQLEQHVTPTSSTSGARAQARKAWKEPSPFTPMAPYDSMATPLLKKAVEKIGVRPVGKKRMRDLLKEVYQQTHQYETDSDYEPTPVKRPREEELQRASSVASQRMNRHGAGTSQAQLKTVQNLVSTNASTASQSNPCGSGSSGALGSAAAVQEKQLLVLENGASENHNGDDLPQSQDSCSSDGADLPEESILQGWPEEENVATQMTQTSEEILVEKLVQFIHSNRDVHEDILMYRPLELDVLKKRTASAGIRMSMQKLMDFLDERCITFTMKNMSSRNNRHQKQPKRKGSVPAKQGGKSDLGA